MVRRALTLAAVLAATGAAGCGEEDSGGGMPDDFALTFEHYDGTVAPPHHREWTVAVRADGSGTVAYVPDYSGPGVPTYRGRFEAPPGEVEALYGDLDDAGLLDDDLGEPDSEPIGGPVEKGTVTAAGETISIPPFDESGASPLTPFADRVEGLAPPGLWRSFERRADAYAERQGDG
jgi:hypothetical protein